LAEIELEQKRVGMTKISVLSAGAALSFLPNASTGESVRSAFECVHRTYLQKVYRSMGQAEGASLSAREIGPIRYEGSVGFTSESLHPPISGKVPIRPDRVSILRADIPVFEDVE
jgi:hypothetical protein